MELEHVSDLPARSMYVGAQEDISVGHGQTLVIETSPQGTELLKVGPAEGKAWVVSIMVNIAENDT